MIINTAQFPRDLESVKTVALQSFSTTPDSSLDEWFSFEQMLKHIEESRGICLKAEDENSQVVGMIYAEQESPINGKESLEKWVIIIAAVAPNQTGKNIGRELLKAIEQEAKTRNIKKMFVYTNQEDERVINFYKKNGYEDAGYIRDYQYGVGNSAVFLLKYL